MTSARASFGIEFLKEVEAEDIQDMATLAPESIEGFQNSLILIQARRDDASPKGGRLMGTLSASFHTRLDDTKMQGRIIYSVASTTITIWAVYHDHDEAYRRARKRYKRRLRG